MDHRHRQEERSGRFPGLELDPDQADRSRARRDPQLPHVSVPAVSGVGEGLDHLVRGCLSRYAVSGSLPDIFCILTGGPRNTDSTKTRTHAHNADLISVKE